MTSFTTSCKLDLDKALLKSIQVLNNGGKWILRGLALPRERIHPNMDEVFPLEPFDSNVHNFDDNFDEQEKHILYTPNPDQKRSLDVR